jgi:hypothetical protein
MVNWNLQKKESNFSLAYKLEKNICVYKNDSN